MSLASMRGAIQAYLNAGAIPALNHVYKAMPVFIDPTRWWELPPDLGAGTIGYLHLARIAEDRIALPAVAGAKMAGYTVALVLIYRWNVQSANLAVPMQGDEWVDGLDATIEAVKAWIRLDPNLGTSQTTLWTGQPGVIYDQFPGAVWQAGQDEGDLSQTTDPPWRDEEGGEVLSFQVLEFHAYEILTA
jgi:hypothetical protein